ncbi:MAG: ArnT family glycosyltransferase [Alphaproteobacteria bacterium]
MTESIGIAVPAVRLAVRASTLARVLQWLALLTILLGAARIVATYPAISITFDEPAHIAAGMQLLDRDKFTYERLHPPLARVAAALGPYIAGYRSQNGLDMWSEGRRLFYTAGHPDYVMLTLARLGILPFFLASLVLVWLWTDRYVGAVEGALAVIALGNLPLLLAHSGLATTDVPFAATFTAAFFAFLLWLDHPSTVRGLLLGATVALAVCTKLSALLFLPAACGPVLAHRWLCSGRDWHPGHLFASWRGLLAGSAAFLLVVWVVYGCNADPLYGIVNLAGGIGELLTLADRGQPSFFLGKLDLDGDWAFFPVLILVRSPIPFLIAVGIGAVVLIRRYRWDWRQMAPLLGAAGLIASVLPSTVNLGLRHLLPAFPLLAIVAAIGLGRLLAPPLLPRRAVLAGLLLVWQTAEAAVATPDYLAYFNQLALGEPEQIVTDSDLDWGHDVDRLAAALKQHRIDRLHLALHTSADLRLHGLPSFEVLFPGRPAAGWVAISEQMHAFYCAGYRWLDAYEPVARVGASIRLYYVPGPAPPADPDVIRRFNWNWYAPLPCSPETISRRNSLPASNEALRSHARPYPDNPAQIPAVRAGMRSLDP